MSDGSSPSQTIFDSDLRRPAARQYIASYNAGASRILRVRLTALQQVEVYLDAFAFSPGRSSASSRQLSPPKRSSISR